MATIYVNQQAILLSYINEPARANRTCLWPHSPAASLCLKSCEAWMWVHCITPYLSTYPYPISALARETYEWPKKCTDVGKSRSCRNCLIIFLLSWPAIWTCVHGAIWIQKLPFTRFTILCMHACQILRSDVASFSKRGELLQTASKLLTITGRSTYIGPIYIKSVTDNNTIIMSTIIRISLPANSSSSSLQDKLA